MKKGVQLKKILALATIALSLSACGKQSAKSSKSESDSLPSSTLVNAAQINLSTPTSNGNVTPIDLSPVVVAPGEEKGPVYQFEINGVGYPSEVRIEVPVRDILKVRFRPETNIDTVANTGFVAQYSHLAVFLDVGSTSQATPLLSNGLIYQQETSNIIDFSSQFTKTCTSSSPTDCRQMVTVKVHKPNYDYWCFNFGMYCSYTHVWDTHPWRGTLLIETDDTEAL